MTTGPVKAILLWALALPAAYHDLRWRRVPNSLILAGTVCGAAVAAWGGRSAILQGAAGFILGFSLLLPFFLLGGVGGGDVKSLAVIGLFTGPHLLFASLFRGACVGGFLALLLLARSRVCLRAGVVPGRMRAPLPTLPYAALLFLAAAFTFSGVVL